MSITAKITAITTMVLMAGAVAQAAPTTAPDRKVTVCVEGLSLPTVDGAGTRARAIASQMFAAIDVTIVWRYEFRGCPEQGIRVTLLERTPDNLKPGALAYALPYEGTHIRIFFDRIARNHNKPHVPIVLAHVLVHEITHILQGISRHSATGVMKAHWELADYRNMTGRPLAFEDKDIDLINFGLEGRARRYAATEARESHPALAGE